MTDQPKTSAAEGWQPIDTVPDGKFVLVCWIDTGEYETVESAHFNGPQMFWSCRGNLRRFNPEQPHQWPSHWMYPPPLPRSVRQERLAKETVDGK